MNNQPNEKQTIYFDTREKTPLIFPEDKYTMQKMTLPTGDYATIIGEKLIIIERKTLNDFVNTVIHNWDRFERELVRMTTPGIADYPMLVVEGSVKDITLGNYTSKATPKAVLGRANQIYTKFPEIIFFFNDNRQKAIQNIIKRLDAIKSKNKGSNK